jgi:hypothetical protein
MDNDVDPILKDYLDQISSLTIWKKNGIKKPHKYILLLAVIRLLKSNPSRPNEFTFDELEELFGELWTECCPDDSSDKGLLEYPFYYLATSDLWHHKIKDGAEHLYEKYRTSKKPRYRFTKPRIKETIDYAYLPDEFYRLLANSATRRRIRAVITEQVNSLFPKATVGKKTTSLFQHEAHAIELIDRGVQKLKLGKTISNLLIYDKPTNDYYECDVIIVAHSGIYLVELKHWTGRIEVRPRSWRVNGTQYRKDPHLTNAFKCRVLKGICTRAVPACADRLWVESVVVLTNPNAEVVGGSSSSTDQHNPTFESLDELFTYLRQRRGGRKAHTAR